MPEGNGYAGTILDVDLCSGRLERRPTLDYAKRFIGGRGIGTKIYWDEVRPEVQAFDLENRLIFITGPATGIAPAGCKWQIFGKSPSTGTFCYSHLGGKGWGLDLKRAGFDGLVIHGRSEKPAYLLVQDGIAQIRDASGLWGKSCGEASQALKQELGQDFRVVTIGPAGENLVAFATLLSDGDASGSSGFGAVMGSKNLKAIAVAGRGDLVPANRERLKEITRYVRHLVGHRSQITNIHLPPDHWHEACPACPGCSSRSFYRAKNGRTGKYTCQSGMVYQDFAEAYHGGPTEVSFLASKLCDDYGLDTWGMMSTLILLSACSSMGTLSDDDTGLPLSQMGSLDLFQALAAKIALREGFGDLLADGPTESAAKLGKAAKRIADSLLADSLGHLPVFDPRLFMSTSLIYAMEPRTHIPQLADLGGTVSCVWKDWAQGMPGAYVSNEVLRGVARRFWGGEAAVDFSTYDGKALAARKVQDRWFGNECVILCLWMLPIWQSEHTEDHVGDPNIESQILSAVTGSQIDEEGLYQVGERVFNLQRAVLAREGHAGRDRDTLSEFFFTQPLQTDGYNEECIVPGKGNEILSRKGAVLGREEFEFMKDEYYCLRGWDKTTGLQTKSKLGELGLHDVVMELERRCMVVP